MGFADAFQITATPGKRPEVFVDALEQVLGTGQAFPQSVSLIPSGMELVP